MPKARLNESALQELLEEFIGKYPRAAAWFSKKLAEHGYEPKAPPKPFPDPAAPRLLAAYRAFLPVASVLLALAAGEAPSLAAKDAKAALAAADKDPAYPPNVLLRLLSMALSGDLAGATKFATQIKKEKLGVPLTQRWAELVASRGGPFAAAG